MKRKFFLLAAGFFILAAPQARAWTDDPVDNTKPIRAVHVTELRAQIDAKRLAAKATGGLCAGIAPVPYLWTDNPLISGSTVIRAIHFKEMRDAIQEVYDKAAQPYPAGNVIFPPNPDPFAAPGGVIRAKHVNDLRTAVTSAPTCSPLPPVCGNGSVEAGEACDAGPANGPCPAACSASCTANVCGGFPCGGPACFLCSGTSCVQDDANGTFSASNCNNTCGGGGSCSPGDERSCTDDIGCSGTETCKADGVWGFCFISFPVCNPADAKLGTPDSICCELQGGGSTACLRWGTPTLECNGCGTGWQVVGSTC